MAAIALDFALLARLAAYAQLLAFALRAALALAPAAVLAAVLATVVLAGAPYLVLIIARRVLRQFRCAVEAGLVRVRNICAVGRRRIHCWSERWERAR